MQKLKKLSNLAIETRLYPEKHPHDSLSLELLPLVFIFGTKMMRGNIHHSIFEIVLNDREFPKKKFQRKKIGFDPNQNCVTRSLTGLCGWDGTFATYPEWKEKVWNFLGDQARCMKLISEKDWRKKNVMTAGQLSLRLALGANSWKHRGELTKILRSKALEKLENSNVDLRKLLICLANGIHEDYWIKETSWHSESKFIYSTMGGYIDFLADEAHLTRSSICSMILHGIRTTRSYKNEPTKSYSAEELFGKSDINQPPKSYGSQGMFEGFKNLE